MVGVDISQNVIEKANQLYGNLVDFYTVEEAGWKRNYELVICLEVLSYIKSYKEQLKYFADIAEYLYLSIYIPKNPIGFIKSIEDIVSQVALFFHIENKIVFNDDSIFLLAKSKK